MKEHNYNYDYLPNEAGYELLKATKENIENICSKYEVSDSLERYIIKLFYADINFITDDLNEYLKELAQKAKEV